LAVTGCDNRVDIHAGRVATRAGEVSEIRIHPEIVHSGVTTQRRMALAQQSPSGSIGTTTCLIQWRQRSADPIRAAKVPPKNAGLHGYALSRIAGIVIASRRAVGFQG